MAVDTRVQSAQICAPCTFTCPIHTDAQGYVSLVGQGRFGEALDLIRETNPLAWSLGMICPHPCETECRRAQVDEAISICNLKRAAAEFGGRREPIRPEASYAERVAVIGAGPSGLAAAMDLFRLGYRVTVFDRNREGGGILQTGVPVYRLPREAIAADVRYLEESGVEFRRGVEVGKSVSFADVLAEGFDAVVIATGLGASRNLNIPGIGTPGVLLALPFLKETNETQRCPDVEGREVVVIGGGSVATDVARSALRAGAKRVRLCCLESRAEMPAQPWEVEAAIEEGTEVSCSLGPKQVLVANGEIRGVEFMAVKSVFDAQRRFNPTFYEDRLSVVEGDRVVVAIGQGSELDFLKDSGVEYARGRLALDPKTWMTTRPGVFACGDVAKGPGAAVYAMGNARAVVQQVHRYLRNGQGVAPVAELQAVVRLETATVEKIPHRRRAEPPTEPVEVRLADFDLPEPGLDRETAMAEAQRCLSCAAGAQITVARCPECLTCLRICPFGVPRVDDGRLVIPLDQCQACSICARECPAQVIEIRREENIPALIRAALAYAPRDQGPIAIVLTCQYSPQIRAVAEDPALAQEGVVVRVLPVMCVARLGQQHYLQALEEGATAVVAVSCEDEDCRFVKGSHRAEERVGRVQEILGMAGLGPHRVRHFRLNGDVEGLAKALREAVGWS